MSESENIIIMVVRVLIFGVMFVFMSEKILSGNIL